MTLTEKIELLIKRTQMSASQFADVINIPRSSISHIVSGRNKPSLDVVQKILRTFPEISAEELLYEDRALVYMPNEGIQKKSSPVSSPKPTVAPSPAPMVGLFDEISESPRELNEKKSPEPSTVQSILTPNENVAPKPDETLIEKPSVVNQMYQNHVGKQIERVIIFYSDGTFSESKPSR